MTIDSDWEDTFIDGYLDAAGWLALDGETMEGTDGYGKDDFALGARDEAAEECCAFIDENREDLEASGLSADRAGCDFYFTRNRHGAGYWDEGLGELGDRLSEKARTYGSVTAIVNSEGCLEWMEG